MFIFYYKHIKGKYASLEKPLFSDADSLRLQLKTEDIFAGTASEAHLTSEYLGHHFLDNTENKSLESSNTRHMVYRLKNFLAYEPTEVNSLLYSENNKMVEKKMAKGIAKHVTKQEIRHKHCFFHQEQQMATRKHQTRQVRLESHWQQAVYFG